LSVKAKWCVGLAFAGYAMIVVARPADAPLLSYSNPAYVPSHQLNPTPVMGVRGDARILKIALAG